MARATLFLLVLVAVALAVYLIAGPKLRHSPQTPVVAPKSDTVPSINSETPSRTSGGDLPRSDTNKSVDSAPPIQTPKSQDEKQKEDREAARGVLYTWIRSNMQKYLVGWQPSSADPAELDLYMARPDPGDIAVCMTNLVERYATHYGFSKVRFYEANAPGAIEAWKIDSEATPDTAGTWNLYRE